MATIGRGRLIMALFKDFYLKTLKIFFDDTLQFLPATDHYANVICKHVISHGILY